MVTFDVPGERCHVSGGEVAGILVAVFWAILVSFLAVALVRLAQTLRATTDWWRR